MAQAVEVFADRFHEAYGHPFAVRCLATDVAVVATIGYEATLSGTTGWIGDEVAGAAFAGAIETQPAPDRLDAPHGHDLADLGRVRDALLGSASTSTAASAFGLTLSLPGRWNAAAWRTGEVVIVNGAAIGRSLWWTQGPNGFAVGSQARLLLDLVGRPAKLNIDCAALSVSFGYVAGSCSLYVGTQRLRPGERIVMRPATPARLDRALSLDDVLGPREAANDDAVIDAFADRVKHLVSAELAMSGDARIGLSGGRDSRLLAAAAARGGWRPPTATGGPARSPDVVLARRVAATLGLKHSSAADHVSGAVSDVPDAREAGGVGRRQPMTIARLATWITMSDGTAPASLAWVNRDLSEGLPSSTAPAGQTLTGLGGETHRGVYFSGARDLDRPGSARRGAALVLDLFASRSSLRRPIRDLLAAEIATTDGLLDVGSLSLSEWLSRFHWRFRENCRGSDTLARADLAMWTWAPLTDAGLLALSRLASAGSLSSGRFVEDATTRLAPELSGIAYDRRLMAPPPEWVLRVVATHGLLPLARRLRSIVQRERQPRRSAQLRAESTAFWDSVYFSPGDHVWPELVDSGRLHRLVREEPDGQILKALAVPELLFRDQKPPS